MDRELEWRNKAQRCMDRELEWRNKAQRQMDRELEWRKKEQIQKGRQSEGKLNIRDIKIKIVRAEKESEETEG